MGVKLPLIRREEHRLRVYENRVLTKIFAPKREEVAGGCINLHKGNRHDFWASPNIIWVKES
jgi:hypothetical protein